MCEMPDHLREGEIDFVLNALADEFLDDRERDLQDDLYFDDYAGDRHEH